MGYYRGGDYYRGGGYYRGGSLLGTIGKGIVGFATGGIGGAIAGVLGGGGSKAPTTQTFSPSTWTDPFPGPGVGMTPTPGIGGVVSRTLPWGSTGYSADPNAAHPAGYHWSKTAGMVPTWPKGKGRWVKNRHTNAGNAHAARRSIRRIVGVRHLLHSIEKSMPHKHCTRQHASHRR